uniref:Uncharacterized protein n=1 Tax=Tetradesmus obliquus TaxID=3088 RepID=A0A383V8X9_TETOB|eukprot:jgi/Sobl393_1/16118/SZX62027.1
MIDVPCAVTINTRQADRDIGTKVAFDYDQWLQQQERCKYEVDVYALLDCTAEEEGCCYTEIEVAGLKQEVAAELTDNFKTKHITREVVCVCVCVCVWASVLLVFMCG